MFAVSVKTVCDETAHFFADAAGSAVFLFFRIFSRR